METGLIIMAIVLVVVIGGLAYALATKSGRETDAPKGVLHINRGDVNNEPGMFLTLDVPVEEVITSSKIVLRVNVIRKNSHK